MRDSADQHQEHPLPRGGWSISQVEQYLGISASVLRVWEDRYGWPRPTRAANGYRRYPRALVAILKRVRDELSRGKAIGDLMRDPWWQQVFESGRLPEPSSRAPVEPPWSSLPMPASPLGRDVRTRLQQALVAADARMARWAQAMGQQLQPEERECAVKPCCGCGISTGRSRPDRDMLGTSIAPRDSAVYVTKHHRVP